MSCWRMLKKTHILKVDLHQSRRQRSIRPGRQIRDRAKNGAGERDRTVVCSLGSCRSTIELHPRVECGADSNTGNINKVITIIVNGATRQLPQSISISDLIADMGMP